MMDQSLETLTSPISGLTLLTWIEIGIITGIISGAGGIILSSWSLFNSARANKKQAKVKSAELILDLLKRLRDTDFIITTNFIIADDSIDTPLNDMWNELYPWDKELQIREMLDHFEHIAILYKDGTLNLEQIKEFFRLNLIGIRDNKMVQEIMKSAIEQNPTTRYKNLKILLDKI